jgi:hypothetical protein
VGEEPAAAEALAAALEALAGAAEVIAAAPAAPFVGEAASVVAEAEDGGDSSTSVDGADADGAATAGAPLAESTGSA